MTRFAAVMGVVILAIYGLRLDDVAGLYVDDAYYVVLAQALAQGQGYALISSATTPILPAFPPGFPLLLAPVVAVTPAFPGNIAALKAVSILAMFAVAALTYRFLVDHREFDRARAGAIATLTALLPGFVFLATSTLMAECVFTLALVASVLAIERAADSPRSAGRLIVAAVLCTASWLVRSAGIAAVIAGVVMLLWRRGWRASAGFLAICLVCYAPWYAYSLAHQPTAAERAAHGGSIVYGYRELLSMRVGGDAASGAAGVAELARRVGKNIANVFGRDIGAVIFPAAYRGPDESGQEVFQLSGESGLLSGSMGLGAPVVITSSALSLFVVFGWIAMIRRRLTAAETVSAVTIGIVILVPSRTFRYVLPIAPFLVTYFLAGIEWVMVRLSGGGAARSAVRIATMCLFVMLGVEHAQYIAVKLGGPTPGWINDGDEVRGVTDWLDANLPPEGGAASTNPGLLYLLTGRRTVAFVDPVRNWERWRQSDIRYVVALHGGSVAGSKPGARLGYRLLHESPRLKLWALELAPPPDRK
jgi:hypothetical protein